MVAIVYRTAGPWGAGKGSNLTPAEVDENFYELVQALDEALNPSDGSGSVGIESITSDGISLTVHLTDGSTQGPFAMPIATFADRGTWAPATVYARLNVVLDPDTGLYLVLQDHTSDAEFDPDRIITGQPVYRLLLPAVVGRISLMEDVAFDTGEPEDGQFLRYDAESGKWIAVYVGALGLLMRDLLDVDLPSDIPDGYILRWNDDDGAWEAEAPPFDIPIFWRGLLTNSCVLARVMVTRPFTIPNLFDGTQLNCGTNPTAEATLHVRKNGSDVGTIVIDTSGEAAYDIEPTDYAVGDIFDVLGPSVADATLADLALTILGNRK